jgi:hypothetical protein
VCLVVLLTAVLCLQVITELLTEREQINTYIAVDPLAYIFNLCMDNGIVPDKFNLARVYMKVMAKWQITVFFLFGVSPACY